jgi:hypothetical protein
MVAKIYESASDSKFQDLYMNMNDAEQRPLDHWPTMSKITSGVDAGFWRCSDNQIRIALWSNDNKPWGNVEHSFYIKVTGGNNSGDRVIQPYIGGGRHSDSTVCHGNAMKVSIWENGSAGFRKEAVHPNYTNERSGRDLGDDFEGRWWGIKVVQILFSNKCRIEIWADTGADDGNGRLVLSGNQNRWRMIGSTEDTGGWSAGSGGSRGCGYTAVTLCYSKKRLCIRNS